jgi:hypothetical protein
MSEETIQEGEFKVKRPKKLMKSQDADFKVDLTNSKTEENAVPESEPTRVVLPSNEESKEERPEAEVELQEVGETHTEEQETPIKSEEKIEDTPLPKEVVAQELPQSVNKLISFMKETGGNIQDYARLNIDYSQVEDSTLLREYYKNTKSHLDSDEIEFVIEDKFAFDEGVDEERDIRKKKLAYKEEIANAREFLEETKKKYYDEIKLRTDISQDQQKANEFYDKWKSNQTKAEEQHQFFKQKTKDFFTNEFKGFKFNVGEKKFNYNISNTDEAVESQSNLNNFIGKFLNKDGSVNDYDSYHKAIYAARNSDKIAQHFYEQGKADATKDMVAKSKNIQDGKPRATSNGDVFINGLKVKAISGADGSKLKIRKRT